MFIVMIFHNITVLTEFLFRLTQPWWAKEISYKNSFFYTNPKIWKVAYFIESMWTEKLNHNVIIQQNQSWFYVRCSLLKQAFLCRAGEIMPFQIRIF